MKKFAILLFFCCFCAAFLGGCQHTGAAPVFRVVTGVEISCQQEDVQIRRVYTDTEKMEYVLIYLRLLEPLGLPQTDPDTLHADVYEITLLLSDGNRKVYRQKDHRYLCCGVGPWQVIAPEQAEGLYRLMRKIPGDRI